MNPCCVKVEPGEYLVYTSDVAVLLSDYQKKGWVGVDLVSGSDASEEQILNVLEQLGEAEDRELTEEEETLLASIILKNPHLRHKVVGISNRLGLNPMKIPTMIKEVFKDAKITREERRKLQDTIKQNKEEYNKLKDVLGPDGNKLLDQFKKGQAPDPKNAKDGLDWFTKLDLDTSGEEMKVVFEIQDLKGISPKDYGLSSDELAEKVKAQLKSLGLRGEELGRIVVENEPKVEGQRRISVDTTNEGLGKILDKNPKMKWEDYTDKVTKKGEPKLKKKRGRKVPLEFQLGELPPQVLPEDQYELDSEALSNDMSVYLTQKKLKEGRDFGDITVDPNTDDKEYRNMRIMIREELVDKFSQEWGLGSQKSLDKEGNKV